MLKPLTPSQKRSKHLKHVFHIHSNINYLSAVLIIVNKSLLKEDVLFLCYRGVECSEQYGNSINIGNTIYLHPFNSPRNIFKLKFFKNKKYINYIDRCIEDAIGTEQFCFYAPHCKNPIYSVLISHPNFVQLHYIEDGMDAYLGAKSLLSRFPESVHFSHKILKVIFSILPWAKVDRTPTFTKLYESIGHEPSICYGINSEAFNNELVTNREIMPLPNSVQEFFRFKPSFDDVFVFDALVEQRVVSLEQLELFWIWFLDDVKSLKMGISVKFHPFQNAQSKELICDLLKSKGIPYEIISDDISMETFFFLNDKCNIYGIGSSLLKYSYIKSPARTHILYEFFERELGFVCNRKASWDAIFK